MLKRRRFSVSDGLMIVFSMGASSDTLVARWGGIEQGANVGAISPFDDFSTGTDVPSNGKSLALPLVPAAAAASAGKEIHEDMNEDELPSPSQVGLCVCG